ncbi:MAG TPA: hypothetical protein VL131_03580 [Gammaproteobacteria bacterium]|nr:hypothetical protein [Gammaproteobacteria bacterium]
MPSPWNRPEQVNTTPCARNVHEIVRRNVAPTSVASLSCVKKPTSASGRHCRNTVTSTITTVFSITAFANVSRTRAPRPAP